MKCPYCSTAGPSQGRCTTSSGGRSITECTSCGRVIEERQTQTHHMFHLRAQDSPLLLSTSDLPPPPQPSGEPDPDDPFEQTGFITAFSTWSLEHCPLFALSSVSFSGHLAELERALESSSSSSSTNSVSGNPSGGVVVDNLRAYLQIVDVASILGLEHDISDHAFQLFRDCSSATFLRNRSVEALATACLVQAIREAQEPRTLQEISIAANLPQKEIGKYIKILGEALQLSQPINSNSIAVHMPRFCNLLQLNKSAQELATHIGEVVMNKCFCTRRNPISISAAAIYLACQLEDRRKTQAEICKVTGLTEVTLRKVYKELLENWDDLLPSNYTPVVPPEKAFPTTTIASGRSSGPRTELPETVVLDQEKQPETKPPKTNQALEMNHQERGKGEAEVESSFPMANKAPTSWKPGPSPFGINSVKTSGDNQNAGQGIGLNKSSPNTQEPEHKVAGSMIYHDRGKGDTEGKANVPGSHKVSNSWKPGIPFGTTTGRTGGENQNANQGVGLNKSGPSSQEVEHKATSFMPHHDRGKGEAEGKASVKSMASWRPGLPFPPTSLKTSGGIPNVNQGSSLKKSSSGTQEAEQKVFGSMRSNPFVAAKVFGASSTARPPLTSSPLPHVQSSQPGQLQTPVSSSQVKEPGKHNEGKGSDPDRG